MRALIVVALASAMVGGCAGGQPVSSPNLISDAPQPTAPIVTGSLPTSGYKLTNNELKYDCRKLTGLMQIRILQVRGYDANKNASLAARGMQTVATPIFGGTKEGLDPEAQHLKDIAALQAYNQQLAAKKCKTFDLAAELGPSAGAVAKTQ